MEEEENQVITSKLQFLYECKRRIERLMLPTLDDEDIKGISVLLEQGKIRIFRELEAEAIAWSVKIPEKLAEENFNEIKGKIMKKIIEHVIKLSEEEEVGTTTKFEPPKF